MNRYAAGQLGGLIATVVLSVIMLMKSAMDLMPQLDVIALISNMMGVSAGIAWLIHFMIGAVWGVIFAALAANIPPGPFWVRGIVLSVGAWLLMMIGLMPMAGAGLFGLTMGIMAPLMTLILHVIFGAVMGFSYAKLAKPDDTAWAVHAHPA